MIKYIQICDKCGVEEETKNGYMPDSWFRLKYQVSRSEYSSTYADKLLCPKCANELKISTNENVNKDKQHSSIGDRLVEILTEIAQGGQE